MVVYTIANYVYNRTITFKEKVGVKGGKAYNQIIISTDTGSFSFGNSGVTAPISKTTSFSTTVFRFPLATLPAFYLTLAGFVKGKITNLNVKADHTYRFSLCSFPPGISVRSSSFSSGRFQQGPGSD